MKRGKIDAAAFTGQKAGCTIVFIELGIFFMYPRSRSICKTTFINTSHIIRKHEHTFGIPAR